MNINFIVEKGGEFAKSSILRSTHVNTKGIKYAPKQLENDVVELSTSLNKNQNLMDNIVKIAAMRKAGATQEEIGKRFGVNRNMIGVFLREHLPNAETEERLFYRAAKKYLLATTSEEKNKAILEADPFLQKIAKEKNKFQKEYSYDDCLQDLRLKFVNAANRKEGKQNYDFKSFVYELKQEANRVPKMEEPIKVSLGEISEDQLATNDISTKIFEESDYCSKRIKNTPLLMRERLASRLYLEDDKNADEIAEKLSRTAAWARMILNDALPRLMEFKDLPRIQ